MENKDKESFAKKIGKVFTALDTKVVGVQRSIVQKMEAWRMKINQKKQNGIMDYILYIFLFPFMTSVHSSVSPSKRRAARYCFVALTLILITLIFLHQKFPSWKDVEENLRQQIDIACIIGWTVLTILIVKLWKVSSMMIVRLFTSLFILVILSIIQFIAFGMTGIHFESQSTPLIVLSVIMGLFFLLWNFWPKGDKQGNIGSGNE